jgi:hypothetical protein
MKTQEKNLSEGVNNCNCLPDGRLAIKKTICRRVSIETERAGFEPAVPAKGTPVFETGSISHSDTSP